MEGWSGLRVAASACSASIDVGCCTGQRRLAHAVNRAQHFNTACGGGGGDSQHVLPVPGAPAQAVDPAQLIHRGLLEAPAGRSKAW